MEVMMKCTILVQKLCPTYLPYVAFSSM